MGNIGRPDELEEEEWEPMPKEAPVEEPSPEVVPEQEPVPA